MQQDNEPNHADYTTKMAGFRLASHSQSPDLDSFEHVFHL